MEQRALGRTGLTVSALGFGCGSVGGLMVRGDADDQQRAVARALDAGISYFDTAPSYGNGRSEENLGRVLTELGAHGRVAVGTKVRLSAEERGDPIPAIRRSLEESLRRLGREYVDLLQLHNPITSGAEAGGLPIGEVLGRVAEGMRGVVAAGLTHHAGFTGIGAPPALRDAAGSGAFATMQAYINALNPSAGYAGAAGGGQDFGGLAGQASEAGVGVIAIRVLAAGALSGSMERVPNASPMGGTPLVRGGEFERDVARAAGLAGIATAWGLESTVEMGVRFVLSVPGVSTVLIGYSDMQQLDDAIRWAERGPLPREAVRQVVAAAR